MAPDSTNYKLYYFDSRGWAEGIRLILQFVGQPYEDVRYTLADWEAKWATEKKRFPYGKVPVLEVGAQQLAESYAIARYLANKYGLSGADEWERAKVDEFADFHKDVFKEIAPYLQALRGFGSGDPKELYSAVFIPAVEKYFPLYEKRLDSSGSGYLAPSGLTWADFFAADYLHSIRSFHPEVLTEKFPTLDEYRARVLGHPKIKDYVAKRSYSINI